MEGSGGRHRPAWRFLPPLHPIIAETAPLTLTTEPVGVLAAPRVPGQVLATVAATGQARLAGRVNGIVAAAPITRDLVDLPLRHAVARHGEQYPVEGAFEDGFETVEVVPPAPDHAAPAPALPEVVTPRDLVAPPAPHVIHARPAAPPLTVAQVQPPQVAETSSTPSRFMHITYREQDRQLAEWYAEQNQTEQPAPNTRTAAEQAPADPDAVEPDAFEPVVQELEFTPPTAGPRRPAPRPSVGRRASLAESRRQGLGIKRKPAQATGEAAAVIIDAPVEAAELPSAQAVPAGDDRETDDRETTVEEAAPPPPSAGPLVAPSSPQAPEPVVAEDAVAVREVKAPEPEDPEIAEPAQLIAPSSTVAPPDTPVESPLETPAAEVAGPAEENARPDLSLREASSRPIRPDTVAQKDAVVEVAPREITPREAARPDPVRREMPLRDKGSRQEAVPEVVQDEIAPPTTAVRPELPLRDATSPRSRRQTAADRGVVPEDVHGETAQPKPVPPETEPVRPGQPLRDVSSPKHARQVAHEVTPTESRENAGLETARLDLPLHDAGSRPSARHEGTRHEDAMPEIAHYETTVHGSAPRATGPRQATPPEIGQDVAAPHEPPHHEPPRHEPPRHETSPHETSGHGTSPHETSGYETGPRQTGPQPTGQSESRPHESASPEVARLEMATYESASQGNGPLDSPPQETVEQETLAGEPIRRVAASPETGPDGLGGGSAQPLVLRNLAAPQPVSPHSASSQPASSQPVSSQPVSSQPVSPHPVSPHPVSPQPAAPQSVAPQSVAPQPTAPHPASPRPTAPVGAASAVPAHQPGGGLELTTTPQLAPVAVSVLGRMVASAFEERVPHTLIAPLRRALNIDLGDVPVRRGEAVSATAERLGARAFTADGAVYLPDDAGAVDSTETAPLLAHELTHAAQQQHFGVTLPGLETVTGQHLETEAVAVEEWVKDGAAGPPPVVYGQVAPERLADADDVIERAQAAPWSPVASAYRTPTSTETALDRFRQAVPGAPAPSAERPDATPAGLLNRMRGPGVRLPPPSADRPDATPAGLLDRMRKQTQAGSLLPPSAERPDATPAGLLDRMRRQRVNAPPQSAGLPLATSAASLDRMRRQGADAPPSTAIPDASVASMFAAMEQITAAQAGPPSAQPPVEPPDEPPEELITYGPDRPPPGWSQGSDSESSASSPQADLAEFVKEVRDNPPRRWLDLDDPDHFDEISHRVYNSLQARFRFDVLLERERNGTLMDFG